MENKELELITEFPKTTHVILGKMMQGFQSSLEDMNLNQTMRRALLILYDKGETTMTELHHAIGLEKGSLTTVVDQLIEKRLVERKRDVADRRKVNILLTSLGRRNVDTLRMEIANYIKKSLDRLQARDQERFYRAVKVLIDISGKL
jgi:DNA-binding MarR family transcriptional regulator